MSYDLNIYGAKALDSTSIKGYIELLEPLRAKMDARESVVVEVIDRRTSNQLFTIDGPFRLEPDDVVNRSIPRIEAKFLYSIVVPGSAESSISEAQRFAELLALKVDGVVVDPQDDSTSPALLPTIAPTESLYLHLSWFRPTDGTADFANAYLNAALEMFPLAVPSRFGLHEPLQGRFSRSSMGELDALYREACAVRSLTFKSRVIENGQIWGWTNDLPQRYQAARVSLQYPAVRAAEAEGDVADFFVRVARDSSSFFAYAELNESRLRSSIWPPFHGAWSGLPPTPQWMTWYSTRYASLVRPYLTAGRTDNFPEGSAHRWTNRPSTTASLGSFVGREPWVAAELLPTTSSDRPREVLSPAALMPDALRPPVPGSREAMRIEANIARNRAREERV